MMLKSFNLIINKRPMLYLRFQIMFPMKDNNRNHIVYVLSVLQRPRSIELSAEEAFFPTKVITFFGCFSVKKKIINLSSNRFNELQLELTSYNFVL